VERGESALDGKYLEKGEAVGGWRRYYHNIGIILNNV
jgi:hypothetical protein